MNLSIVFLSTVVGVSAGVEPTTGSVVHPSVRQWLEAEGGTAKVWVFLRDKGFVTSAEQARALRRVGSEFSARALVRRALRGTHPELFTVQDLPVAPGYVEALRATGAEVRVQSHWLNAVSVRATEAQVRRIAELDCVTKIQPVGRWRLVPPVPAVPPARPPRALTGRDAFYGLSYDQLVQINLVALHEAGYAGAGVVIGVLDSGFARTHDVYTYPGHEINVLAEWDFVADDGDTGFDPDDPIIPDPHGDVYQHAHGTIVLSTIAGYNPGTFVGGAYDASFILAKTEDVSAEYPGEEDLYVAGLEFIEQQGADLVTSSLGYHQWYDWFDMDGLTAVTTIAVNAATANGLVCCTAAGNGGRDSDLPTLIAPGDAFDVITCGAVKENGAIVDFSSGGPTFDGRVKPEVLAQGEFVDAADALDDDAYVNEDGTSMSTPLVASAVACVLQAHPTWTIAQLRANLFETSGYFVAHGETDPEYARGYGLLNAFEAALDCNGNDVADLRETFTAGDFNADGEVDLDDYRGFVECAAGPDTPPAPPADSCVSTCLIVFDSDTDGDVDLADFAAFSISLAE